MFIPILCDSMVYCSEVGNLFSSLSYLYISHLLCRYSDNCCSLRVNHSTICIFHFILSIVVLCLFEQLLYIQTIESFAMERRIARPVSGEFSMRGRSYLSTIPAISPIVTLLLFACVIINLINIYNL